MIPEQYVWLLWSVAFLVPWAIIYVYYPRQRKAMLWASLFTMPFGLTEPIFVPEYWSPPSLFDLALTTGFDIESLIFCFGIGGTGSVLYNLFIRKHPKVASYDFRNNALHRHHLKALATPFAVFLLLYFFAWNPIYPSIIAMFLGAIATILCRPDLKKKTWVGGILFLIYYLVFLIGMEITAPGYIDKVWNHEALTGIAFGFIPVEELLFAYTFGMYWAGVYEHFTWHKQ